jgi:hypothetical protein
MAKMAVQLIPKQEYIFIGMGLGLPPTPQGPMRHTLTPYRKIHTPSGGASGWAVAHPEIWPRKRDPV